LGSSSWISTAMAAAIASAPESDANNIPAFIVMKVGFHAEEELDQILRRKQNEIADGSYCLWGYGGSACHPITQVQPFVKRTASLEVLFVPTTSRPKLGTLTSTSFSEDGTQWKVIPGHCHVSASKYALVLDHIELVDEVVDLSQFEIAIGPSEGRPASGYLLGRVDKACVRRSFSAAGRVAAPHRVLARARLAPPYGVLLRQ
jgi:hypothetical protein